MIWFRRALAALLAFACAQSAVARALAEPVAALTPVRGAMLQALLDRRVAASPGTGIVVGVIDHGVVALAQAGTSGTARPLDAHTLFEVGSVTKTFTATILASMVLDRSVALDDPLTKDLPPQTRVPSRHGKTITLLNLATQHSGLPRMPDTLHPRDGYDPYADYTQRDMLRFVSGYRLTRDPGAAFEYSNLGIALLGNALAYRARLPYQTLLQRRVLDPLGMRESVLATPGVSDGPPFAAARTMDNDPAHPWHFDAFAPAGALRSSLADMVAFLRCTMGQGPLARACLFAQRPRDTFPGHGIGLVWFTDDALGIVNHEGDTSGFHAAVAVSADRTIGVVVLANGGEGVGDLARHLVDPRTRLSTPAPAPAPTPSLAPEQLDAFAADYGDKDQPHILAIRRDGDHLTAQLSGQPAARLYPSAKDTFVFHVVDAELDFVRDAAGNLNGVVVLQDNETSRLQRFGATPLAAPTPVPQAQLDDATLAEYVGVYALDGTPTYTIARAGSGLTVQVTGQRAYPIFASAKDAFFLKVVVARIDFLRDPQGRVVTFVLHQGGHDYVAHKVR